VPRHFAVELTPERLVQGAAHRGRLRHAGGEQVGAGDLQSHRPQVSQVAQQRLARRPASERDREGLERLWRDAPRLEWVDASQPVAGAG